MDILELLERRKEYLLLKAARDKAVADLTMILADFDGLPDVVAARDGVRQARDIFECAEVALRQAVEERYLRQGDKTPADGLGIRVSKDYTIVDAEAAREWALTECSALLLLDEKALINFHRHVQPVPFVEEAEKITVTISPSMKAD